MELISCFSFFLSFSVQPPHVAPYPPMQSAAPPSYDVAVSGAGAGVPNNGSYEKQAPYNPNFSG